MTELKQKPLGTAKTQMVQGLTQILGADLISTDQEVLAAAHTDVMGALEPAAIVVEPDTQEMLLQVARYCSENRFPMVVKGGGASYTHAHVPAVSGTVLLDTNRLNQIIAIDAADLTITVEPNVTWEAVDKALEPLGLRLPFWGPFSGHKSTIGGSLSQHAISLGSGLFDASNSIVTGMKVITGMGEIVETGPTKSRFYRTYGPDISGLFLGDSGALGIKSEITLRLMARPTNIDAASFAYPDFESMSAAMIAAARLNLASEIVAIDPALQQGQMGAMSSSDLIPTSLAIIKSSPGPFSAVKALAKAALGARGILKRPSFLVQYIVEGHSRNEVQAKVASLREVISTGGIETANAMALAMRGDPFKPLTPVLGPQGERWLPMHAVFSYSKVPPFHDALMQYLSDEKEQMDAYGVRIANMYLTVGPSAFVYEPTFYWPDSQHAAHVSLMPPEHRKTLPVHADNPEVRAYVFEMKNRMIALMKQFDAAHYQIGKCYPYLSTREEGAKSLLLALKNELDPYNLINPGALEFPLHVPRAAN